MSWIDAPMKVGLTISTIVIVFAMVVNPKFSEDEPPPAPEPTECEVELEVEQRTLKQCERDHEQLRQAVSKFREVLCDLHPETEQAKELLKQAKEPPKLPPPTKAFCEAECKTGCWFIAPTEHSDCLAGCAVTDAEGVDACYWKCDGECPEIAPGHYKHCLKHCLKTGDKPMNQEGL